MRKKLYDLAEHLQSAMNDARLGQELLHLAEYGSNEDITAAYRLLVGDR